MSTRSPRTILAISAALALTASALGSGAALAKGPGSGSGAAGCDGDCTADQAQSQQLQRQLRDSSGSGGQQRARIQEDAEVATQARAGNRAANENRANGTGNGNGYRANDDPASTASGSGNANRAGQGQNAKSGAGRGPDEDGERGPGTCDDCDAEMGTLTDEQAEKLIYMYNEEKMAHDIYAAFAEQYGVRVFENIAAAEARHMEAVSTVIERYGLGDATLELEAAGTFGVPTISMLHETLMEQGSASLEDAIEVGVLIEETDIDDLVLSMADLETSETEVAAPDVYEMYSHLLAGSQNHLSAFQGWQ